MSRDAAVPVADRDGSALIDPKVFTAYMAVIGDRLGRQLEPPTVRLYYADLCARLDTEAFSRGARAMFDSELYGQWPSVDAICEAAGVTRAPYAVPDVAATARMLAAEASRPAPSPDALAQFGAEWRAALADCQPKPRGLPKAYALARQPLEATPWRCSTGAPDPREIPAIHTAPRPSAPAPRPPMADAVDRVMADLMAFAPLEESDAVAR